MSFQNRVLLLGIPALTLAGIICGLGTLKVYLPAHTQWLIAFALILVGAVAQSGSQFKRIWEVDFRIFLPWIGFFTAIVLAAILNGLWFPELSLTVSTLVKMLLLAVVVVALVHMRVTAEQVEFILSVTLVITAIGLAAALFHDSWLLRHPGGRIGWTWNWVGFLWKSGMYVLPFAVWRAARGSAWAAFPMLLLSASVIALDGSRTGLLAILLVIAAALAIEIWRNRSVSTIVGTGTCLLAIGLAYGVVQPTVLRLLNEGQNGRIAAASIIMAMAVWPIANTRNVLQFAGKAVTIASSLTALGLLLFLAVPHSNPMPGTTTSPQPPVSVVSSAAERLAGGDDIRFTMLMNGLKGAYENFPFGAGLGMTTAEVGGAPMHVHMTYLQLVSDIGVAGVIFYLSIFCVFIWMYGNAGADDRARGLPLLAIVLIYLFSGLFAPLSNEISDWFPILLAFAAIYDLRQRVGRGAVTAAAAS